MDALTWIIVVVGGLVALEILLWVLFGVGGALTYICATIYHMFKLEAPPGENDDSWSQDQAREVDDKSGSD